MVDTSILIAAERGKVDLATWMSGLGETPIIMAATTASELLSGWEQAAESTAKEERGRYVEDILGLIPVAAFGLPEARLHARLWGRLKRSGRLIGAHDMMIAATTLVVDYELATLNVKEFSRIPGLRLVPLDQFHKPHY